MSLLYDGDVRVYLQGKNALLPTDITSKQITYWIGDESTRLQIKDYRHASRSAAQEVLDGDQEFDFADFFNQSAQAKITTNPDGNLDIELYETSSLQTRPILWVGILEDNIIPNYETEWEYLKPLNSESTAVAILIK